MYNIHNKLREFQDKHPFLFAALEILANMITAIILILGMVMPIILAIAINIVFCLLMFFTIPVAVALANFITECFMI